MTVAQALEIAGRMQPHAVDEADLLRWLTSLDGQIYREVLLAHEDAPEAPEAYGQDDGERVLLVREPYAELYPLYLAAKIDYQHAELERYNNSMVMYQTALAAYTSWYTRAHMPLRVADMKVSL